MNIKYLIKKIFKYKIIYLVGIFMLLILIIGSFSYAIFTTKNESKGALNIVVGNLQPSITSSDLDSDNEISIKPNEDITIPITINNVNKTKIKANLYYSATDAENLNIGYVSDNDSASNILLNKVETDNSNKVVNVRMVNNGNSNIVIKFASAVSLINSELSIPSNCYLLNKFISKGNDYNQFIEVAYIYNQDKNDESNYCVTGIETSCKQKKLSKNTTYDKGTIIKYKINSNNSLYFNVLKDNGDKLILQQRENTIDNVIWNNENIISDGPISVLSVLKNSTDDWTNVDELEYTLSDNTLCNKENITNCTTGYTINNVKARARLITLNEIIEQNCQYKNLDTCPIYMTNYLSDSINNNGTINTDQIGYWTSTVTNEGINTYALISPGILDDIPINTNSIAIRAVIEIEK